MVLTVLVLMLIASAPAGAAFTAIPPAQISEQSDPVPVGVGAKLSTVIGAAEVDVQSAVDQSEFDLEVSSADSEDASQEFRNRSVTLVNRRAEIQSDLRALRDQVSRGNISESSYAREVALIHARSVALEQAYQHFEQTYASTIQVSEIGAGDQNQSVSGPNGNLSGVQNESGSEAAGGVVGPTNASLAAEAAAAAQLNSRTRAAVFDQLTGVVAGEIRLRFGDGVEIEIERGDGVVSRSWERPGDGDQSFLIGPETASEQASTVLPSLSQRQWVANGSPEELGDGTYELEYYLLGNPGTDLQVTVDGSSGAIVEYMYETGANEESASDIQNESVQDLPGNASDIQNESVQDLPGNASDIQNESVQDLPGNASDIQNESVQDLPGNASDIQNESVQDLPGNASSSGSSSDPIEVGPSEDEDGTTDQDDGDDGSNPNTEAPDSGDSVGQPSDGSTTPEADEDDSPDNSEGRDGIY